MCVFSHGTQHGEVLVVADDQVEQPRDADETVPTRRTIASETLPRRNAWREWQRPMKQNGLGRGGRRQALAAVNRYVKGRKALR